VVQAFVDHRSQRPRLHGRVVGEEGPRAPVRRVVTREVLSGVRGFIDVWFRAVRRREDDVVAGIDECHRRHDSLVEVLPCCSSPSALHFDSRGVGTDDDDLSLGHTSS
jgi:hypothetical protein